MRTPSLRFKWVVPTTHEDGKPITAPSALTFRLYENGNPTPVVDDINVRETERTGEGESEFDLLMDPENQGEKTYHMTSVLYGLESSPSESVTVNFSQPAAPTNLTVELFDAAA